MKNKLNLVILGIVTICILSASSILLFLYMDETPNQGTLAVEEFMRTEFITEYEIPLGTTVSPDSPDDTEAPGKEVDPNLLRRVDFDALQEINADCERWVYLPDTNIDYYVMQEQEVGEYYYLWRDIYKHKSKWGSILTAKIPLDMDDAHLLIFGHRMKDRGVAFSGLLAFMDEEYGREHTSVYLYYPDHSERWSLWSAAKIRETDMMYQIPYTLGSDEYQVLLDHIAEVAAYQLTEQPDRDTRTVVLTTCNGTGYRWCLTFVPDETYYY